MFRDDDDDSNDEFMGNLGAYDAQSNPLGLSKAELRKNNKPIMEKKRRARINNCLNELKTLILEALKKDPARHTKLEKADILEMTVKHLQTVQRSASKYSKKSNISHQQQQQQQHQLQSQQSVHDSAGILHKFNAGFADCTHEVSRYISDMDDVDTTVKQRLIGHLSSCADSLPQPFGAAATSSVSTSGYTIPVESIFPSRQNVQHPHRSAPAISMGGVQLIPSRLPTGELALIMPNSNNLPYFPSTTSASASSSSAEAMLFGKQQHLHQQQQAAIYPRLELAGTPAATTTSPPLSPNSSSMSTCSDESLQVTADDDVRSPLATDGGYTSAAHLTTASYYPADLAPISMATLPTVQQSQISSTTTIEIAKIKPLSVITNSNQRNINNNTAASGEPISLVFGNTLTATKKRSHVALMAEDDGECGKQLIAGLLQVAGDDAHASAKIFKPCSDDALTGDMWRPW